MSRDYPSRAAIGFSALTLWALIACSGASNPTAFGAELGGPTPPIEASTSNGGMDGGGVGDAEGGPRPEPKAVRFIGRFDMSAGEGAATAFPGARIIARFSGTEVKATLGDAKAFTDYGENRWEVVLDGALIQRLRLSRERTTYSLAAGLAPGAHTIELHKITEANVGTSRFFEFEFPGGELLSPPPRATRRIEFLGDSASNGYGIDDTAPENCSFSAEKQNARQSYPAVLAERLGAEAHTITASGKGVLRNFYRPDTDVFSSLYLRTLPFAQSAWDFTRFQPDVVWVTLGGNDYDRTFQTEAPPDFGEYQTKYSELITLIRQKNPDAHIVCAVPPSLNDSYPPGFLAYTSVVAAATNVAAAKAAAGDAKVHVFKFTRSTPADLTACQFHPNVAKHRAMADEAAAFLATKAGWR